MSIDRLRSVAAGFELVKALSGTPTPNYEILVIPCARICDHIVFDTATGITTIVYPCEANQNGIQSKQEVTIDPNNPNDPVSSRQISCQQLSPQDPALPDTP
jgi:hypothetical protein